MPLTYCTGTGKPITQPECSCEECTERMIARHAVGLIDIGIAPSRDDVIPHGRKRRLTFDELRVMRSR